MNSYSTPDGRRAALPPRPRRRESAAGFWLTFLAFTLGVAACRDSKAVVYRIPKEHDAAAAAAVPAGNSGAPAAGNPAAFAVTPAGAGELEWTAPAHWKSKAASAMRKGTFVVGEEGAPDAELAITAFPGDVGGDLANVNRWRGQLGLPAIAEAELANALTPVEANGLKMLVVELAGGTSEKPLRMLGAIVPFRGATWFFKMTGSDPVVAREKSAYLEFLRTVKAGAAAEPVAAANPAMPAAPAANGPGLTTAEGPGLKWIAPDHWQGKAPSAMRKATYVIAGENGATAELAVTAFPGDVGGELANVNRWRGQLQLPPIAESDLTGAVTRLAAGGLTVTVVDVTGGPADQPVRLLGAMVPSHGANWYFKLTGPPALVAREKPGFLALVQSLRAP